MLRYIAFFYKKGFIALFTCFFLQPAFAQVRTCFDAPKEDAGNVRGESGVYDVNSKWTNGSTITVKFLNGSEYVRNKVKRYAVIWEEYANIKFRFTDFGNADIRITFNWGKGSWSVAGNYAALMPQSQASMNYGWFNESTAEDEFRATTLHEFGHALGLLHEHKSPYSKIQWNLPVLYAYYMQSQGWSKEKVDDQVVNRYSVTMSNKEYDPYSVMHYPVPAAHTTNGYSVGWNSQLSANDKKLIGELYPFPSRRTITVDPSPGGEAAATCTLANVAVEHNVYRNNLKGMLIKASFDISNAKDKNCLIAAYFYLSDGKSLKDFNGDYKDAGGNVAVSKTIVPIYPASRFTNEELFMPYDELHMVDGKHQLKFSLSVWDHRQNELAQGGATYFTYRKGATFSAIESLTSFENNNGRMVVMPKFTIENAKGANYQVYAYMYYRDGTPVQWYNASSGRYEPLAFSNTFAPGYETTTYNFGYYSDLYIYVPYQYFGVFNRRTLYKYYVAIFKDGKQVATGQWVDFYLDR
jgi:Astacin (Peptidase family M12A)